MKNYQPSAFQPETSFCDNKWCSTKGSVPATGVPSNISKCGDIQTMMKQQLETGGVTGRGVTPCPFGYLQEVQQKGNTTLIPYQNDINTDMIFFEPNKPGYLPPQGNPRPLIQVGYTWRN